MKIVWRLHRSFMRLAHLFNWHHMAVIGPLPDGRKQAWCQWCGLRDWVYDPARAQMEIRAATIMDQATEKP